MANAHVCAQDQNGSRLHVTSRGGHKGRMAAKVSAGGPMKGVDKKHLATNSCHGLPDSWALTAPGSRTLLPAKLGTTFAPSFTTRPEP